MSKHIHESHDCAHDVKYCKHCDLCYCTKCSREWGVQATWWPYWSSPSSSYPWPTTTTWASSDTVVDNNDTYMLMQGHSH